MGDNQRCICKNEKENIQISTAGGIIDLPYVHRELNGRLVDCPAWLHHLSYVLGIFQF